MAIAKNKKIVVTGFTPFIFYSDLNMNITEKQVIHNKDELYSIHFE